MICREVISVIKVIVEFKRSGGGYYKQKKKSN